MLTGTYSTDTATVPRKPRGPRRAIDFRGRGIGKRKGAATPICFRFENRRLPAGKWHTPKTKATMGASKGPRGQERIAGGNSLRESLLQAAFLAPRPAGLPSKTSGTIPRQARFRRRTRGGMGRPVGTARSRRGFSKRRRLGPAGHGWRSNVERFRKRLSSTTSTGLRDRATVSHRAEQEGCPVAAPAKNAVWGMQDPDKDKGEKNAENNQTRHSYIPKI